MLPQPKNNYGPTIYRPNAGVSRIVKAVNDNEPTLESIANSGAEYIRESINRAYNASTDAYKLRLFMAANDFRERVPGKNLVVLPRSVMGGILGLTYLGQDYMVLRDDLIGDKEDVDVHESVHTDDENETRYITDSILSIRNFEPANDNYVRLRQKYVR